MAKVKWQISGDYLESCNCNPGCPCIFNSPPTKGFCNFISAFYIKQGNYGRVRLNDLKIVSIINSPGNMWEGNYTQALYIEEKATKKQREALKTIFTGAAGGGAFAVLFGEFVSNFLGVKYVSISFDSKSRDVSIPGILAFKLEPIRGVTGKVPKIVDADFISVHRVGKAISSTYADYEMRWDNTDGHAFISRFELSGP